MLLTLYRLWRSLQFKEQARFAAWGLSAQSLLDRNAFSNDVWGDCDDALRTAVAEDEYRVRRIGLCGLVVAWYRRSPWTDAELVELLSRYVDEHSQFDATVRELLNNLGDAGQRVVADWDRKRAETEAKRRERKPRKH
jgi:hypothetical protein